MAGPPEGGVPRVPPVAGGVRVGMRLGPRAFAHWVAFADMTLMLAVLGLCSAGQACWICMQGFCV